MSSESRKPGYWRRRADAFRYAWQGIVTLVREEQHARIHLLATVCVVVFGIIFRVSPTEWCLLAICIGGVWMGEGFNSAIERLANRVSRERHPLIKAAKDLAAGAVLLFVIAAVAVGLIIFIPKFIS